MNIKGEWAAYALARLGKGRWGTWMALLVAAASTGCMPSYFDCCQNVDSNTRLGSVGSCECAAGAVCSVQAFERCPGTSFCYVANEEDPEWDAPMCPGLPDGGGPFEPDASR